MVLLTVVVLNVEVVCALYYCSDMVLWIHQNGYAFVWRFPAIYSFIFVANNDRNVLIWTWRWLDRQKFHANIHTYNSTLFSVPWFPDSLSYTEFVYCHRKPVQKSWMKEKDEEKQHWLGWLVSSFLYLINSICLALRRRRRWSLPLNYTIYTHPNPFRLKEIWISDDEY